MSDCAVTVPSTLPPCDSSCTECMLGLLNVEPKRDIWELLRVILSFKTYVHYLLSLFIQIVLDLRYWPGACSQQGGSAMEEALCSELLTNSQRLGVDLLYSNMEKLLPLPSTQLTTSTCKLELSVSVSQDQPSVNPKDVQSTSLHGVLPSHARLLHTVETEDFSDDGSPVKMSNRMRKTKRRHQLPDQDGLHSDSDSEDGFLSLCKPQRAPQMKDEVKESLVTKTVKRKPLTPQERQKSLPVSQCLESIADFLDNMSFMDSSLLVHPEAGNNRRRTSPGALVKDGMTDESRVEIDRGCLVRDESALEIPAAVEALSFYKCRLSTVTAWNKAQQLEGVLGQEAAAELSLPVAAHRNGYSFSQDSPCRPQWVLSAYLCTISWSLWIGT